MRFQDIKKIEISIGAGVDAFPMYHGSFTYIENEKWHKKLKVETVEETDQRLVLALKEDNETKAGTITAEKKQDLISIDMQFEREDINRYELTFTVGENEHYYGCGETFSKFDLKGEKVRIWVAEHQNEKRIEQKLKRGQQVLPFSEDESYYAQPTFISSARYFVHVDTTSYMEFDFTQKGKVSLNLRQNAKILIGNAENFESLSEKLSGLLGKQKELPEWLYNGAILGIQAGNEIIDEKIEKLEKSGVKIAGIWSQDWCGCRRTDFGYRVRWNWKWEESLYPDLPQKIKEWNERGIRFLGYINPFLIMDEDLYQEASQKGYCVKDKDHKDYLVRSGSFEAALIDFTNPNAYQWYKEIIKNNMIGIGMSGWMADFGEYLPTDCVLYSGEDPKMVHNTWPAIWARMNWEAIVETGKEKEIFFFTRAGFTETVRYSTVMWNGDQHVDWSVDEGIGSVIPATLSLAMSGFGITHSDAGGYTAMQSMTRSKELLMRWEEMNVFSPLLRTHEGNQPDRNVQFDEDEELLAHLSEMTRIHIGLKEYLKELVQQEAEHGTPVIRPLFYHYDEEQAYVESYEYMLGRDLLIAPVLEEEVKERKCYLPKDHWIHLFSRKEYSGGSVTVNAPIGEPPVFIRAGSKWKDSLLLLVENK